MIFTAYWKKAVIPDGAFKEQDKPINMIEFHNK